MSCKVQKFVCSDCVTYVKSRIKFNTFNTFNNVINDSDDKSDEAEIFEEIISLLHCFAMKMYSKRRKRKLEIVQEDLKNEISL